MWTWPHDVSSCTVGELACAEQKVEVNEVEVKSFFGLSFWVRP